jgi:hypothetical protein
MVTDAQVRVMRQKRMEGKTQESAAAAGDMSVRTAREWENGSLPSQSKPTRHWRTRGDPFETVWESEVVPLLNLDDKGVLEGTTVLGRSSHSGVVGPPRCENDDDLHARAPQRSRGAESDRYDPAVDFRRLSGMGLG